MVHLGEVVQSGEENQFTKVNHNHGHNILRLFNTLPIFVFTTSETKRDY